VCIILVVCSTVIINIYILIRLFIIVLLSYCFDIMALRLNKIVGPPFPADNLNYYLQVDFPKTGTYSFTALTSFYLIYMDSFDISDCRLAWERELKNRVAVEDLAKGKLFQAELLDMGLHPNNFLTNMKVLLSDLPYRYIPVYSE